MPSLGLVSTPILIGRDRELAVVDAFLRDGTLLVSGEAGIGKSRLLREAAGRAATAGHRVLQGHCFDRDKALPYRKDEISAGLSRFLAKIDRERIAAELTLTPLSSSEVERQIRAILELPRPAGSVFVGSWHGRTGGNPFFVEEVLCSLIAECGVFPSRDSWQRKPLDQRRVPRCVDDAVQRREANEWRSPLSPGSVRGPFSGFCRSSVDQLPCAA